jgi:hypothetical protein
VIDLLLCEQERDRHKFRTCSRGAEEKEDRGRTRYLFTECVANVTHFYILECLNINVYAYVSYCSTVFSVSFHIPICGYHCLCGRYDGVLGKGGPTHS